MKQTPGPWRIGDAGLTVFGPANGQPSPETVAHVRKRSDARLIRAAPEMRNALARVAVVQASKHSAGFLIIDEDAWARVQDTARALLTQIDTE